MEDKETAESGELAFLKEYGRRKPQYDRVLAQLMAMFDEYQRVQASNAKLRVHSIRGRVKEPPSLFAKARKEALATSSEIFTKITDVVGARIVCNTLEGKAAACLWLEAQQRQEPQPFKISSSRDVLYPSGYRSRHYLISLTNAAWPTLRVDPMDNDEHVTVEVQVRTILEEAWGEIEHDLVYKGDGGRPIRDDGSVRPGFKALSHRLHDADILVHRLTKRIVDTPNAFTQAGALAKEQRSLEIDVTQLGLIDEAAIADLDRLLGEAQRERLAGNHDEAYRLHQGLLRDARFNTPVARRVVFSELGLDRLIKAQTILHQGVDGDSAKQFLAEAEDSYQAAMAADPEGSNVVIRYRQSQVAVLQKRFSEARGHLIESLELMNKRKPSYLRTPFYKARLRSRLGALDLGEYESLLAKEPPASAEELAAPLGRAGKNLWEARGDHEIARPEIPSPEWMRDAMGIYNNLAWFLYRNGQLTEAREAVESAKESVDPAIWEQDLHFLGTILAVEFALLPDAPTFDDLTWLDSVRIRILNILQMRGTFVFRSTAQSMLARISKFEELWRRIALQSVLDERSEG